MIDYHPIIQKLDLKDALYQVDVLRLDLIDPEISGNKWFKLKQNLEKAFSENHTTIITFGGAHSNHIAATAAACNKAGLISVGIIRGEENNETLNPTLLKAKENGMQLLFVSREFYAQKNTLGFKSFLEKKFGKHYLVPEGGNNTEGCLGCMEIVNTEWNYDYVFCACGTGTTYAGLLASAQLTQKVIGINVLKGENRLVKDSEEMLKLILQDKEVAVHGNDALEGVYIKDHCIINTYCFNGYAKLDKGLISFKKQFEVDFNIPLDYVYTNKLFYAVFDLMKQRKLKENSKLLILHSGGLQGNRGFEKRYHLV